MSNIYIQEPPTEGKVLLETTVGDIEIELWSREAPKACRNFIQLCLESYYDKTVFHRVVKNFIVQGGDPSGTGQGGESIWGHPFKDEFHSRLRFVRRGLVAMANAGKDDNGSQFFFTMAPTPELQNKHTIFAKVVGDTVYNMIKLQDGTIIDEKPDYPQKILRTKVLSNPFKDIVPREKIKRIKDEKSRKPKSKMKATKDFKLLSFGDEAEEEEGDLDEVQKAYSGKGKSSHDLLKDPKLSSEVGLEPVTSKKNKRKHEDDDEPVERAEEEDSSNLDAIKNKLKKVSKKEEVKVKEEKKDDFEVNSDDDLDTQEKKRDEIRKQIRALKREMKGEEKKVEVKEEKKKEDLTEEEKNNDMLRSFHEEQKKYAKKSKIPKKKTSAREEMTMKLLEKFKQKLSSAREHVSEKAETPIDDKKEEEDEEELNNDDSWMAHDLKFQSDDPILAKDASTKDDDWFDIFDPRNPLNKRRRQAKK